MRTGRVTFWSVEKAFGFIRPSDGGADQFVHITGIADGLTELKIGDVVEFSTTTDRKTLKEKAENVRLI
jgi:CspA family cold shock protein